MRRDAKTVEWLLLLRHHLQQGGLPGLSSPAGGGGLYTPRQKWAPFPVQGTGCAGREGPTPSGAQLMAGLSHLHTLQHHWGGSSPGPAPPRAISTSQEPAESRARALAHFTPRLPSL